jgi:hypothetical protein
MRLSKNNLNSRWEDLNDIEYMELIDKILYAYELVKEDYKKYIEGEEEALGKLKDNCGIDIRSILSGFNIEDKDLQFTKGLIKSEKNGRQNEAITKVLSDVKLIDPDILYIEFGAGKGGLSFHINTLTNDKTTHVLLERDGVRFKRDRHSENMHRVSAS